MNVEDRLRQAMRREVEGVEPSSDARDRIEQKMAAAERRRRGRAGGLAALAAAAAVALVVGALALFGGDDTQDVGTVPADTTDAPPTSSVAPHPTTTTIVSPPAAGVPDEALFPRDGTAGRDPLELARAFAVEYLAMSGPLEIGPFQAGDARSGEVPVARQQTPRLVTRVLVRQGSGDGWYVTGAAADNIGVAQPTALVAVVSPLELRGAASAFEGTVTVLVHDDTGGPQRPLGESFVTGSGGPELGPFEGTVEFATPATRWGAVVFSTHSMEDGAVQEATVVRVQFAELGETPGTSECEPPAPTLAPPDDTMTTVVITLACGGVPDFVEVPRRIRRTPAVLRAALEQLLAGPTPAEEAAGLTSFFSAETADALLGVTIRDGRAIVDLDGTLPDLLPGAGTSNGSAVLVGQLNRTVFQFPTVDEIEYRLDGSCEAFYRWLESDCQIIDRNAVQPN